MKVCMLTSGHSHMDNRVFYKEAQTLKENGYEVSLVVPLNQEGYFLDPVNKPIVDIYPNQSFEKDGIMVWGYQKTRRDTLKLHPDEIRYQVHLDFIRYINENVPGDLELGLIERGMKIDADVYHAHEISSVYAAVKIKQLKEKEGKLVKVVYDVHEYFPSIYADAVATQEQYREKYHEMIRQFDSCIIPHCDQIITVSEAIRGYVLQCDSRANVNVVTNVPILNKLDQTRKKTNHFPVVCYEGHIRFERGLKELLEMTEKISRFYPDFRLIMVGEAIGEERVFLEQTVEEKKLSNNVQVTGWQTPQKAAEWLAQCDVGLHIYTDLPYCHLSLSNKLFNYMRAELAIISVDYPEVGRVIRDSGCGILIRDLNSDQWVAAIIKLIEDKDSIESMKEKSREAYMNTYNWEVEKHKLLRVYNELSQ